MGANLKEVKIALENEILRLLEKDPKVKVGLVTFESKIKILDSRNSNHVEVRDKDKEVMFKEDILFELGQASFEGRFDQTIQFNYSNLQKTIQSLKPTGRTALGPALVVSIGAASKAGPGTQILLCTDGLSNEGIGNV